MKQQFVDWWEGGASVMVAILFWIIVCLIVAVAAAHESLDLLIKALTVAITAVLGLAVYSATRAFQKATVENAAAKLRLDLLDKRIPVWESFRDLRKEVNSQGNVAPSDVLAFRDLAREIEMLFGNEELISAIKRYADLSFVAAGRPKRIDGLIFAIPTTGMEKTMALQSFEKLGGEIADMIKDEIAIRIPSG